MTTPRDQQDLPLSPVTEENSLRSRISEKTPPFFCIAKKRAWEGHPSLPNGTEVSFLIQGLLSPARWQLGCCLSPDVTNSTFPCSLTRPDILCFVLKEKIWSIKSCVGGTPHRDLQKLLSFIFLLKTVLSHNICIKLVFPEVFPTCVSWPNRRYQFSFTSPALSTKFLAVLDLLLYVPMCYHVTWSKKNLYRLLHLVTVRPATLLWLLACNRRNIFLNIFDGCVEPYSGHASQMCIIRIIRWITTTTTTKYCTNFLYLFHHFFYEIISFMNWDLFFPPQEISWSFFLPVTCIVLQKEGISNKTPVRHLKPVSTRQGPQICLWLLL